MMPDAADVADLNAVMALMPEDASYPCEVTVTSRDAQGRPTAIEITPIEESSHAHE